MTKYHLAQLTMDYVRFVNKSSLTVIQTEPAIISAHRLKVLASKLMVVHLELAC